MPSSHRPAARTASALVALTFLCVAPAAAQIAGVHPKAPQLPGSTRAMALGDSYVMDSGHADALFYHPSLLTNARGFGLETQRWGPSSSSAAVSAAIQAFGGGIGVGLRTLQYSSFGSGDLAAPPGQDHLFALGSVPVSERVATLGYAREVFADVDLGVAVNLIDGRVGTRRQSVAVFDVGVSRDAGPFVVGLTATSIGDKPILDTGAEPTRVVLGAGTYGRPVGIFDIGASAHVGAADGDATFGAGVEVGYWPIQGRTFVARVGFENVPEGSEAQPITTGFAFWADNFTIEWAFRPFSGADEGGTHRFGVRWR